MMTISEELILGLDNFPSEILVRIFQSLPVKDLYFGAAQVNTRWRRIVQQNMKRMPLVPVHCLVYIMDTTSCSSDKIDSSTQFSFSVYDKKDKDYLKNMRECKKGRTDFTEMLVSHRMGSLESEWDIREEGTSNPRRIEENVARSILKCMSVSAIQFEVRKEGRKTVRRLSDNRFAHVLEFIEGVCGNSRIVWVCQKLKTRVENQTAKSLHLSSRSPSFPWVFDSLSQKRLSSLRSLRYLQLSNMHVPDCFGPAKVVGGISLSRLKSLRCSVDMRHRREMDGGFTWVDIDGQILSLLLENHRKNIEMNAYSDVPQLVTSITAADMCNFIRAWRTLLRPWLIRNLVFNTTVSISEFRTVASRMSLFEECHLQDVPYCRFKTFHPADPNLSLELCVYANGTATQWSIRSYYPPSISVD